VEALGDGDGDGDGDGHGDGDGDAPRGIATGSLHLDEDMAPDPHA